MKAQHALMFAKLIETAHEQVSYDPYIPELIIAGMKYTGKAAIDETLASEEFDLTGELIESSTEKEWGEDVWWYALQLAAKETVVIAESRKLRVV